MGMTATSHAFHASNVAGAQRVPGAITGINLDFAGQMKDQPAFGKRMEGPLSGTVNLLHPIPQSLTPAAGSEPPRTGRWRHHHDPLPRGHRRARDVGIVVP